MPAPLIALLVIAVLAAALIIWGRIVSAQNSRDRIVAGDIFWNFFATHDSGTIHDIMSAMSNTNYTEAEVRSALNWLFGTRKVFLSHPEGVETWHLARPSL